jgi:hypothetical protein
MVKGPVSGRILVVGLATFAVVLGGCSSSGSPPISTPQRGWLTQTGFFTRRSWPSAHLHLTREEIDSSGRLSDLLRGLDGIRFRPPRPGDFGIEQVQASGDRTCQVHVYVNGNRTSPHPAGDRVSLDEVFETRAIDGLEFHLAPDGPVFEEDGCGTLLLWSEDLRSPNDRAFQGEIQGRVTSSSADPVLRVDLEPVGLSRVPGPEGAFWFSGLLPGEYELVFSTRSGPTARMDLRVFAFWKSRVDMEIGKPARDPVCVPARRWL